MPLAPVSAREHLNAFEFKTLFIEDLGWSNASSPAALEFECHGQFFVRKEIANLSGIPVFEVTSALAAIPDSETCRLVHKTVANVNHEHLIIFLDAERTQSLWYWVKRDGTRPIYRRHTYFRGQPGDLFLSKISAMFVDIGDVDAEGGLGVAAAAARIQKALDIETTTKKFFVEFKAEHAEFLGLIRGIDEDRDRRWYASVLLNRLMFVYFLQRKGFLDGGDRE